MPAAFVDNDVATVRSEPSRTGEVVVALYRGDSIDVLGAESDWTKVGLGRDREGWVQRLKVRDTGLLEVAFIDVGQGDACLVTTPARRTILVDGGENRLASRYLAARFGGGATVVFDAIVVTHGDADHFEGLSSLVLDAAIEPRVEKRIRVEADRVFHSGLVKRSSSVPDRERLGPPLSTKERMLVPLVDDPRTVADANKHFRRWQAALTELAARRRTEIRRVDTSTREPFAFLDVRVDVLGPRAHIAEDGRAYVEMLAAGEGGGGSAAQTINGHSVVLMITHGHVRILLTGDIHAGAQDALVQQSVAGSLWLRADVLKVPHHGSDDVSRNFLQAVQPLVSVISAGDEDARRDYLHPRANLLGMLGRADRGAEPVIFVTNLSAFDRWAGSAFYAVEESGGWKPDVARGTFYARERTAYGIIHVRTDGTRLLVARRGARKDRVEAYSFEIDAAGRARALAVDRV